MRDHAILASILLLTLQGTSARADTICRWSDKQGQIHFSDIAPASASPICIRSSGPASETDVSGLRPTEMEMLLQMEQRAQQQAQRAETRRLQNNRERAEQREHCNTNRKELKKSTRDESYKRYSRYLRNHCW